MLFQVYGDMAIYQWLAMIAVLVGLILLNEFARKTKFGGAVTFFVVPAILTAYFVAIQIGAATGAEWALKNQTYIYMNGWFHYAKLYAALTGCIGFMMIKYGWGIGKQHWFKPFPFVIVAINILIAVCSDFETAYKGWYSFFLSNENVWLYGGWHNIMNGVAGLLNIFCMTAWWSVYSSKDKTDMLWPDMTWVYILVYDVWNFAYTYNCLPTHSWFCGIALLLAPTIAACCWNKGGWIQNRANTLTIWCMFAQVWPLFQVATVDGVCKPWATLPSLYVGQTPQSLALVTDGSQITADPTAMTVVSACALVLNVIALGYIIYQSKKRHINPDKEDVFVNQKYYKDAAARMA